MKTFIATSGGRTARLHRAAILAAAVLEVGCGRCVADAAARRRHRAGQNHGHRDGRKRCPRIQRGVRTMRRKCDALF